MPIRSKLLGTEDEAPLIVASQAHETDTPALAETLAPPAVIPRAVCAKFVIDASAAECLHASTDHLREVEVQVGGEDGRSPLTAPPEAVQGPASRPVPRSDS